jgi:hypothetical protein
MSVAARNSLKVLEIGTVPSNIEPIIVFATNHQSQFCTAHSSWNKLQVQISEILIFAIYSVQYKIFSR